MAQVNMISYRQGIRNKGFQVTVPTTGATQTLSLSGLAKSFEGIVFSSTTSAAPATIVNAMQLRVTNSSGASQILNATVYYKNEI